LAESEVLNILVFTTLYPNNIWPNNGVFVKERMVHAARSKECSVKVVAPVPWFPPIKLGSRWMYSQIHHKEIVEGLDVWHPRYFLVPKTAMALHGFTMFLSILPAIKRLQRTFDFDIIDAHYVYPDGLAGVLLGRCLKKPVVVSARGSDINSFSEFPSIRPLLQKALNTADRVIAVSDALKQAMVRLRVPSDKIFVIPNGVDLTKFYSIPKHEARKSLDLPLDRKIILSVASLTPNKGGDLLINSLKILKERDNRQCPYLVLVGEGPFRSKLEGSISHLRIDKDVRLVGAVPHRDLYKWYSAADLFCLASAREGWPNVILESLACGTPVVATGVGGIPEILSEDEVGILTDRSEKAIANSIHVALRKSWSYDACIRHAQKYSWERAALSIRSVFESAMEAGARTRANA
jgi:glycosyltransferase involved in cell wall biosynthesis